MTITIYGIPNCDTMKKARTWLSDNGVPHDFHNYKKQGIDEATLEKWVDAVGYEMLVNKRGTTWRKLDDEQKDNIDRDSAISLMAENPSLIKRPVLDNGKGYIVGFKADDYAEKLL